MYIIFRKGADTMNQQQTLDRLAKYIDSLMENSGAENPAWNMERVRGGNKPNHWNYVDGCMITALLALYDIKKDKKYLDFCDAFMGFFVQEDGTIHTYSPDNFNLDNIAPGRTLFTQQTIVFGIKIFIPNRYGWMGYLWHSLFICNTKLNITTARDAKILIISS